MINSGPSAHSWRFFRAGGFDQVKLETGADLMALDQLDLKLWVALACPTTGLEFDKTTLALIDTDKDGRVRAPELIAAVQWAGGLLKQPDDLLQGAPVLRVAAINDLVAEGKLIADFARQVLKKADADQITVEAAAAAAQAFAAEPFNGDGIVPADSAGDEASRSVINDIITCLGADTDASGKPGVSQAKVDKFFAEASAYSDWWRKAEGDARLLPLGPETAAAAAAIEAVRAKVEDYFARCQLAAFDPRSLGPLNRDEKDYVVLAAKTLTATHAEIAGFPLARVEANRPLPLVDGVNPAWAGALAQLQAVAVKPLLGEMSEITAGDWAALVARLSPFEAWTTGKSGGAVEKLGLDRVREILAGRTKETLTAMIARDQAQAVNSAAAIGLNRLAHYHRDLNQLCHNFVSFSDFYGRKQKAIFQAGTLYLDQRSCELCLTVEDGGRHAALAALAGSYLAYCDCVRKGTGEKLQIVAAFTGGDSDNLMVGRNGIFFDRKGRDWDATITQIMDNPISIRQAFFAPYKKLARMIEEQAAKRAAAADDGGRRPNGSGRPGDGWRTGPQARRPPKPKIDTGTLAAIGLVLTTLLGALGGIFGHIVGLPWWQMPLALLAILLAISSPSMMIAWLKLRNATSAPSWTPTVGR